MFISGWANGKDAAFDVAVVSPMQEQLKRKAAEEALSAADKRYSDKMKKYRIPCEREGIEFFPLVVETFGGWHPQSAEVITKLARQLSAQSGQPFEETSRHIYQRLSILLTKGNSAMILSRRTTFTEAPIDGDVDL